MTTEYDEKAREMMIRVEFHMAFPYLAQIYPILHLRVRKYSMNAAEQCKNGTWICNWNNKKHFSWQPKKKAIGEYYL